MAQRVLDINVAYAEGLKDVNLFTKMDVYVVVSITGGKSSSIKQKTNVDRDSGTHPSWNFPMRFTFDEPCALQDRLYLVFQLKCEGSLTDTCIGEVRVPIIDLMDSSSQVNSTKFVHYQVTSPSGKGQGMLTFSYKFGEKINDSTPVEPADRSAKDPQPLESNPYPYPYQYQYQYQYQYPAPHEQVLGSGYTNQPAPGQYVDPYPYQCTPDQQATGSLYNCVMPNTTTPRPEYLYSPYQQPLQEVFPPPLPGGYMLPPHVQSASLYPPQPEYPNNGYIGYGYQ